MSGPLLGIDIGGSKLVVGLVDGDGRVLVHHRSAWPALTADAVTGTVLAQARALLADWAGPPPIAVGATIPGLADPRRGLWLEASFSGIRELPVAALLRDELGLPAYLDNDAQACALAERRFGVCQGVDDFLYLTVSNGVGGAVFAGGRLLYGANSAAGEIGHLVVAEPGRRCGCGGTGCLEMHASGRAIALSYRELGGAATAGDAAAVAALARAGDPVAAEAFETAGRHLGTAIGAACNLTNPAVVVIGGGVSQAFDLLERPLRAALTRSSYVARRHPARVVASGFGALGGLAGAAAVAVRGLADRPDAGVVD